MPTRALAPWPCGHLCAVSVMHQHHVRCLARLVSAGRQAIQPTPTMTECAKRTISRCDMTRECWVRCPVRRSAPHASRGHVLPPYQCGGGAARGLPRGAKCPNLLPRGAHPRAAPPPPLSPHWCFIGAGISVALLCARPPSLARWPLAPWPGAMPPSSEDCVMPEEERERISQALLSGCLVGLSRRAVSSGGGWRRRRGRAWRVCERMIGGGEHGGRPVVLVEERSAPSDKRLTGRAL